MLVTPRTLSGFRDHLPKEAIAKEKLLKKVTQVFESFGFVPIETPHMEYAEVLIKQGSKEIQKELYRFQDHGGRDVALRFDQTVPLARFISQYRNELPLPFKRYVVGNVFRGERAQRGRYREFTQCDFDFIGSNSIACDAEIIQVIYASMLSLGIEDFTIWLNHRSILNGICQYFGIKEETDIQNALRIIDKIDKIGPEGVSAELKEALRLTDKTIEALLKTTSIKQTQDKEEFFAEIAPMKQWNAELKKGIEELEQMYQILQDLEMDKSSYRVNFSIARGLAYYTGIIYETTITRLKSLGSVCSGGRYDNLTKTFSKESMSGVGASIGLDRLLVGLEDLGLLSQKSTTARILIICTNEKYLSLAHRIAESFRRSEVNTEVYPEITKLKKQLSYADQKGHEFSVIIGEEEYKNRALTLKNMTTGIQLDCLSFLKALEIIKS
ncbi:histidine--tRNA ligase [Helicobacter mustelae]|uniref:Histidine--tRNA ligase n=1 Tax=Helicobacter mustelae (strain ATCC 43772 / CCUG 25715 / CIP 103759 / LMG 18044 / NCTC 12198 / R85-136P) TaxID=679897 RepID=D3UIA4_HELM1|nr:histidine--tRNA ligase [Helicobacter mustelae]CBG40227.1 putative histidyl-tRNA synthetase [Helicobacter mustelae 12198]SQH71726.1 histidyl-tRNA synthetase [Helicobacter mustelae]STP12853.1 histidyl-tRNA synthetase [Helicobacter mustelae]